MADAAPLTPVFVISMADAQARRAAFAARSEGAPLSWRFFDARTGLVPGLHIDEATVERNKGRPLKAGEIGCYASHYAIWQQMVEEDIPQAILLEDDTIIDWAYLARLAQTDLSAEGIAYLRLYAKRPTFGRTIRQDFLQHSRSIVELVGHAYGTQGYAITQQGARRFLRICATIARPIDDIMDRSWEHGVRNLMLYPAPILEAFVESGIGTERFEGRRAGAYYSRRQKIARWVSTQRMRMKKLQVLRGH